MAEEIKKGGISVDIEHIFPIIKKWLYSEKEIFLREIVSNASDAVTKLKRLSSLGKADGIDVSGFKITVTLDKGERTLTVSDNGIGMSRDELERYLCQIALSGAVEFIQKYEGDGQEASKDGIIGHFGLGFYSSFMVSDEVTVVTRSYTDSPAVKWVCTSDGEYEIFDGEREERGTDVIMKISSEESEFLTEGKIRQILNKFCAFMPVPIYFVVEGDEKEDNEPVNDTTPLWQKSPSECTEEEYKEFYGKVFNDFKEPLFYIHINADYPLNFKGILYFPKLNHEYDSLEGQVKLYYNQVFVADNIKEVIPEYMLMLKGVLDCPELPLNVSRSYLQNSGYVAKISAHIVKKVADKLNSLFNNEREKYEGLWDDIKTFVEYASIRDKKFHDRVKKNVIFRSATENGKFYTLDEYLEIAKEKHENTVYYATDVTTQAQYISMFESEQIQIILLDRMLDTQYIHTVEQDRSEVKFVRIDADTAVLKNDGEITESEKVTEIFKKVSKNEELKVKYESLKDEKTPALINISEQSRRFEDMMKMYRMDGMPNMPTDMTLIVNVNSALVQKLISLSQSDEEKAHLLAKQIYTLSLIAQRQLTADELKAFLNESYEMLMNI
ncbi:MAG: molecular chaperone HtpG [Clostridia bacterium]|nr:molecular chaperone HtpG [Clostridia bacterium]